MPYTTRLACTLGKREDMLCEVDPKIDTRPSQVYQEHSGGYQAPEQ